ncbi:DUF2111 domain-containing protein [Methanohalophilus mahii]|uniref:DUF2111 domain-containing protein n=1 Tax=Methanohalophilus mahii (strain ATCC 35705 / DSM 5219 / SLP) TaxID=547558 RepID=D5EC03_METMS|nr:DUF2111 domain-containing protein [Methanohalophilus mahii]ADE36704.1 conserved hypothetical protein [Methanohalophilus mahii DSM 5219]
MICLKICKDSTAEDLEPIASAVHSLLGIPTTIRSVNGKGIRMEKGEVVDWDYTGPILEKVLEEKTTIRTVPKEGVYKGKAVAVTPIKTPDGEIVGALGVVDLVAALDILSVFREYPGIIDEVEEARKRHT